MYVIHSETLTLSLTLTGQVGGSLVHLGQRSKINEIFKKLIKNPEIVGLFPAYSLLPLGALPARPVKMMPVSGCPCVQP